MEKIFDLMQTVTEETRVPLDFTVRLNEEGMWVAKVTEDGKTLCDRRGEKYLMTISDDPEDAVERLDQLCA